ncbi:hypothetical protein [Oryza sativa Japonica Group]|uniref:Uncharacterized protein n=1 Tax=Oryza sativa subsp. japonica TaxID=39947 RepID=Q5JJY9_ORYSJ|nr:hypothetical protein [Oryza sativa Japonica Group]BAD88218.1 hypothetical protein [Oryza sativa Japonica Group]
MALSPSKGGALEGGPRMEGEAAGRRWTEWPQAGSAAATPLKPLPPPANRQPRRAAASAVAAACRRRH